MLIKSIIINNFRVYSGVNAVELAVSEEKNITVISGNNGFGKTSFLTSLVWCLYGKLMADVDGRYRQEIYEGGGYKAFCKKLMNRDAVNEINVLGGKTSDQELNRLDDYVINGSNSFSVSVELSEILIPSVPCQSVLVTRTYNVQSQTEQITILIDGKSNELTKQVGSEIFINDFILPKEIAKFFFFDAEKIVSLAEIKNSDEKVYLSQAYAEVIGIKKYSDLRGNLLNTRLRLREKSAHKGDRIKLEKLQKEHHDNERLIENLKIEIQENHDELISKKSISDNYQIQLIREGSNLSVDQIKVLKDRQQALSENLAALRSRFNELLELAPFAIAGVKMKEVKVQLEHEFNNSAVSAALMENKFNEIKSSIQAGRELLDIQWNQEEAIINLIKGALLANISPDQKVLLDFTTEQYNKFNAIYENLQDAYSKSFRRLVTEQRRIQFVLTSIQRKLQDAESKEKDVVIQNIRNAKLLVDEQITITEEEINNQEAKIFSLQLENQTISRQLSELTKRVKMEEIDLEKDQIAERLIEKLDVFIGQLKEKKKASLERNLTVELNRLMHKDFVKKVRVTIEGDLIDIELLNDDLQIINKELLSKGEQQLYATALLKALVQESHIRFPIFIDSPLQKFDKTHSRNIIREFYPNINSQLILFPLLENEMNEDDYKILLPRIGRSYLIRQNSNFNSFFEEVEAEHLFEVYNQLYV